AGHEGEVLVWNLQTHSLVRRVPASGLSVLSIEFSPDGRLLAAGTNARDVRIWRIPDWELVDKIELLDDPQGVSFSADSRALFACDRAGTIRMWPIGSDGSSSKKTAQFSEAYHAWKAHNDEIYKMAICRKTEELVTAGRDGVVSAWS